MASSTSFFKRSLLAAVAMASLSGISSVAYAANLANLSTTQWSSKSTDLGSFGAGYGASFTMDLTNGALVGEAAGDASIQLFGTKMTIVNLTADANINDTSAEGASASVELVGSSVYDESWNDGFSLEKEFCVQFFDVSSTFTLVVVPITITAAAEGCATLAGTATPSYNTTTHEAKLDMDVTPGADVSLEVSVGAGSSAFSAGVEAEVTLLDLSIPITLDPAYDFDNAAFNYDSTGQITLGMLDGKVSVYAKADFGFWDVKYSKKIFDWNGISNDWYLWSTGEPTASSPMATINSGTATGTYSFEDTAGTAEGTSTYVWKRASSATGTGSETISGATSASRILVEADSEKYLQFCVTPRNASPNSPAGPEQCSDWEYVGKLASFYQHSSYGGNNLAIAYENATSGTCFKLEDNGSTYDNWTSSYKLYAPTNSSATFHFFKDTACSNTSSSEYMTQTVSAGSSYTTTYVGSSWNDRLSSFKVIFNETVEASDVTVSVEGNEATAAYSFNVADSSNTTESGTTYVWYRASNSSGSGSATISGSTSATHTLGYSDDMKYLKVCVTPSNGYTTGTQVCSNWSAVGRLLKMFEDSNQGGSHIAIAWEKSSRDHCFNLTDYGFNDVISSYNWYNNAVSSSTIWFYKDSNCSGTSATRTVASGSSEQVTSVYNTMGSAWQDSISSFKVSWNSTVAISTPSLTISNNKATESHTYSDSLGYSESATYTWYRASDSSGTSSAVIANALSNTYELDGVDNKMYLKVCVFSSNGWNVDESEQCSSWVSVGSLVRVYADTNLGGTDVNIAYEKSASGTCINLSTMSIDNWLSSYWLYAPTNSSATMYRYKDSDCTGGVTNATASANANVSYNVATSIDNTASSIKIVY